MAMNPIIRKQQRLFIRITDLPSADQGSPAVDQRLPALAEFIPKAMQYFSKYSSALALHPSDPYKDRQPPLPAKRPRESDLKEELRLELEAMAAKYMRQ
jgi:hypothetical protein